MLNALGLTIKEGVHVDFIKHCPNFEPEDGDDGYRKVLLVRDPVNRFISTVLSRCRIMYQLPYPYITTRNLLSMLYDSNMVKENDVFEGCYFSSDIRHHFKQQAAFKTGLEWDYIYNIDDDLNLIFQKVSEDLSLPQFMFDKMNATDGAKEYTGDFYGDIPFGHLPDSTSKHPDAWLDLSMQTMLRDLYQDDFNLMDKCIRL